MNNFRIEKTLKPKAKEIDFLTKKIDTEIPGKNIECSPFGFFIRNDSEEIIAGCNGVVFCGSIYTDQLWVDKSYRNQGLGRKLMNEVHQYGKESGCSFATLATMDFQNALPFYQKFGYKIELERHGYTHDASCIFLKKML